jgi:3-keto steroid reductase
VPIGNRENPSKQSPRSAKLTLSSHSGLGFAICCRLIDEFLHTRPQSQILHLLPTVRSRSKATDTVTRLQSHLTTTLLTYEKTTPGISRLLQPRVKFQPELVDLCDLVSVRQLAKRLLKDGGIPKLDALVCNAGMGDWTMNWPMAIWTVMTDTVEAVTRPKFKVGKIGALAPTLSSKYGERRSSSSTMKSTMQEKEDEEPPLGQIFAANMFGHYILGHDLAPLLSRGGRTYRGRIIWLSSVEADAADWNGHVDDDIQSLQNDLAYENIKRLTDIMALTAGLPATKRSVDKYLSSHDEAQAEVAGVKDEEVARLQIFVCHPGIIGTNIVPLPWILQIGMVLATYFARLLGSIWHPITAYKGAVAPVWLVLASAETLQNMEAETKSSDVTRGGKGKWGSATNAWGEERVERSEVSGWGYGGRVVEGPVGRRKGRWRDAIDLTQEKREEFEDLGRRAWIKMEEMRVQWEERVDRIVKDIGEELSI